VEEIHKQLVAFYEAVPQRADGTPNVESIEMKGETYRLDTANWYNYKTWVQDDHDRFFAEFVQSEPGSMASTFSERDGPSSSAKETPL
jgi:hypothetical protein